ncbi:MAG: NifU family protein [Bacteroidota bacterium]|jgi:Fe-S cluster biogenesis protein NfuA
MTETDSNIIEKIEGALESIRPYLHADGGDVSFIELTEDKTVRVELKGACKSCSMSNMTMKVGIEETILRAVPEIKSVEAVSR